MIIIPLASLLPPSAVRCGETGIRGVCGGGNLYTSSVSPIRYFFYFWFRVLAYQMCHIRTAKPELIIHLFFAHVEIPIEGNIYGQAQLGLG